MFGTCARLIVCHVSSAMAKYGVEVMVLEEVVRTM
jgi:hypothetical protein